MEFCQYPGVQGCGSVRQGVIHRWLYGGAWALPFSAAIVGTLALLAVRYRVCPYACMVPVLVAP